jgi:hypothetical protein
MSPETPSLAPRKVLIVAASPYQAPFLARRLSRSGAAAVVVNSAEAALGSGLRIPAGRRARAGSGCSARRSGRPRPRAAARRRRRGYGRR